MLSLKNKRLKRLWEEPEISNGSFPFYVNSAYIDVSTVDLDLVKLLEKQIPKNLISALDSWILLPNKESGEIKLLKKLALLLKKYYRPAIGEKIYRGYGINEHYQSDDIEKETLSYTFNLDIAKFFGKSITEMTIDKNTEYLPITPELYYIVAKIRKFDISEKLEVQNEIIIFK